MPKFNDVNLEKWREETVLTDSLWLFQERDKYGKHNGFYHGNFIPQIPNQLIRRYSKKGDLIVDPFVGSGTTVFECEELGRNCIGIDIQEEMIDYIKQNADADTESHFCELFVGDSTSDSFFETNIIPTMRKHGKEYAQLIILHPPYSDIIRFSDKREDLSNSKNIDEFIDRFTKVVVNVTALLEKGRHLAVVIGDKYSSGKWVPLAFLCMDAILKTGLNLKSIVVKNMEGNRKKINRQDIWRYRALASDYYIFKHEYILIFKKG